MLILKLISLSIILLGIAFIGFATQILFKNLILNKKGKFPQISIGKNKNMRKLGLRCAKCEEIKSCKTKKLKKK